MTNQNEATNPENRTDLAGRLDVLVMRCATCKHWEGDKVKARKMNEDNPVSMTLENGWPDYAPCGNKYEFLEVNIHGDAWVEHEFAANFGCVYWCA